MSVRFPLAPHSVLQSLASDSAAPDAAEPAWARERERLLRIIAQQQRVAQTGLITAGLVHEIANHVMLIKGISFAALRGCDPARWRSALRQVDERCEELSETMQTMLAFAGRHEGGEVETFGASDVIEQALRLIQPLASVRQVALMRSVEDDAVLVGDRRLLIQALMNLGSNAIHACDGQAGNVTFRTTCIDDRWCRIEVEDDGLGVPEYMRPRLFRPFASSRAGSGGTGLGLFLVRQAVRRMGGVIRVETSPAGTRMRLEIPVAERKDAVQASQTSVPAAATP